LTFAPRKTCLAAATSRFYAINVTASDSIHDKFNKINKFYIKCDEVSDAADALSKTSNVTSWEVQGEEPTYVPVPQEDINSHRNMFRKDLNELIKLGEEVKEIFE